MTDQPFPGVTPERREQLLAARVYYDTHDAVTGEPIKPDPPHMARGIEIVIPPEPKRDPGVVIEATLDHGMVFAWELDERHQSMAWRRNHVWRSMRGGHGYEAWTWPDVVAEAAKRGWRLHLYRKGGAPMAPENTTPERDEHGFSRHNVDALHERTASGNPARPSEKSGAVDKMINDGIRIELSSLKQDLFSKSVRDMSAAEALDWVVGVIDDRIETRSGT